MAAKTTAERRVRRQKQFIAVGTVILLAILGFELPKMLGGHGDQTASPVTTAPPALVGSSPVLASGKLPDTDRIAVERDTGQLLSFGLFKSKDPFVQQLSATASPPPATPLPQPKTVPASIKPATTTTTPGTTSPTSTAPSTTPVIPSSRPATTAPASTTPTAPPAAPTSVLISTNGVCQQISVNGTFPANQDIFRLVSIAKDGKSIKVGIVGGSYDSGQATATVKLGQRLTLVNTADGTRYVIVFEERCSVIAPNTATSAANPVSPPSPPAPPTTPVTTTTPTTPIVTDGLDTTPAPSG